MERSRTDGAAGDGLDGGDQDVAVRAAGEPGQAAGHGLGVHPDRSGEGRRGQRVDRVVRAGQRDGGAPALRRDRG